MTIECEDLFGAGIINDPTSANLLSFMPLRTWIGLKLIDDPNKDSTNCSTHFPGLLWRRREADASVARTDRRPTGRAANPHGRCTTSRLGRTTAERAFPMALEMAKVLEEWRVYGEPKQTKAAQAIQFYHGPTTLTVSCTRIGT